MNSVTSRSFRSLLFFFAALSLFGCWLIGAPEAVIVCISVVSMVIGFSLGGVNRLQNCCIVVASVALTFIAADFVIRGLWPELIYHRPHDMFARRIPSYPMLWRYEPNVAYWGEIYGDLASIAKDKSLRDRRVVKFVTDSAGFRNTMLSEKIDVVVLGDSFSLGTGTTQDSTWVSLLSTNLDLNAYNLSMPGNPQRHFINLQKEFSRLRIGPGAVVLLAIFGGNDLDETYIRTNDFAAIAPQELYAVCKFSIRSFRDRSPIGHLTNAILRREEYRQQADMVLTKQFPNGRTIAFYEPYADRTRRSPREIVDHSNSTRLEKALSTLKTYCQRHSLDLTIALLPAKEEVYRWCVDNRSPWTTGTEASGFGVVLDHYCRRHSIPFLDLKNVMASEARVVFEKSGQCLWWYDDTHMNHNGHKVIATALGEHIQQHFHM